MLKVLVFMPVLGAGLVAILPGRFAAWLWRLALFFALFFIMSVAASYEIIEWLYAVVEGGNAGIEFLGSQGDVWDAQKDMLADTLGAITALILFVLIRPDRRYTDTSTATLQSF